MSVFHHVIYQEILKIMGCGHSKTNIQSKKDRNKNNVKKEEMLEKSSSNVDLVYGVADGNEKKEDEMKTINTIPLTVAQRKLSYSQQNFFKMLDEKIENGRDYDDTSSLEMGNTRLALLLKDWETASAGSRSLEGTPKKNKSTSHNASTKTNSVSDQATKLEKRLPTNRQNTTPLPQSVIHQSYGVTPVSNNENNLTYVQTKNSSLASLLSPYHSYNKCSYQAFNPLFTNESNNSLPSIAKSMSDNQTICSIKISKQTKSIPYSNNSKSSDFQKSSRQCCINKDLIQQQVQNELKYGQSKELGQYKMIKEQQSIQQHQLQYQQQQYNQLMTGNCQSDIHVPTTVTQSYRECLKKNQIER